MKKVKKFASVLIITSFGLFGCSTSIESDAKEVANLQCEAQQLMTKAATGDLSVISESTALMTKATELTNKMESKYTTIEDKTKFAEALLKALSNCN